LVPQRINPRFRDRHAAIRQIGDESLERGIGLALARQLPLEGCLHPSLDHRAGLAGCLVGEIVLGQGRHLDLQIDAVEQRPGDFAAVARHNVRCAAAFRAGVPKITAGTRIHRRHELKVRRKIGLARGAGDGDAARFQRLAQRFQHGTRKLLLGISNIARIFQFSHANLNQLPLLSGAQMTRRTAICCHSPRIPSTTTPVAKQSSSL
jgi:hypothetical protein